MKPALIVHGGAWSIPDQLNEPHLTGVKRAIDLVYPLLAEGLSAFDAVEKAVNLLEEDPTFDAGRGSFLNSIGEIEMDAIIMDGLTMKFGAVGAVQNILHPVSVARLVMEKTEHALLVGSGAQRFAIEQGFEILEPVTLLTERELEFYQSIRNDPAFTTRKPFEPHPTGTVGAVALDCNGNLAAATSTGGTPRKLPGRVGDSPLPGCGTYADNETAAASATGWGESIMRVCLTKTACDLAGNMDAIGAAELALAQMKRRVDGLGGLILIDREGHYGFAYNTRKMAFAYHDPKHGTIVRIT